MPQHGTIHHSLYNAFSFGLFAAYELESEDRELLQKLISEWRSQWPREQLASRQGQSSPGRPPSDWLEGQAQSGSHQTLQREGWPDFVFAFHDNEEIGPRMLARIAKRTGLTPGDL
jgi:hypothetical protein